MTAPRYFPIGQRALTVEFGDGISPALNDKALNLAARLDAGNYSWLRETVPAYASLTVFYDLAQVRSEFAKYSSAAEAVKAVIDALLKDLSQKPEQARRKITIPVKFDKNSAPDLEFVASSNGLTQSEVIKLFTGREYRVYMLGFLPGFAYMGEIDERIAAPRRPDPRTRVPKGSVGIAGRQTGVYSLESPGGWQIIGRTEMEMFRPFDLEPAALRPGDIVTFIDAEK